MAINFDEKTYRLTAIGLDLIPNVTLDLSDLLKDEINKTEEDS